MGRNRRNGNRNQRGGNQPQRRVPPPSAPPQESWWGKLRPSRGFYEAIFAPLFVGVIITFLTLWLTELGQHRYTKDQLERVKDREEKQISANTKLRQDLENLRKKNEELASLHPILQFYGANAKVIASFDLKKEVGAGLTIGKCPQAPCLVFTIRGFIGNAALLGMKGVWAGMQTSQIGADADAVTYALPIKKGCRQNFRADKYDITFVIEDDRHSFLKVGIGISVASSPQEGLLGGEL